MIDISLITDCFRTLSNVFENNEEESRFIPQDGIEKLKIAKIKKKFNRNHKKINNILFDLSKLLSVKKEKDEEDKGDKKSQLDLFYEYLQVLISTLEGKGYTREQLENMALQCQDASTTLHLLMLEEDEILRKKLAAQEKLDKENAEYAEWFKELLAKMRKDWAWLDGDITEDYERYYSLVEKLNNLKLEKKVSQIAIEGLKHEIQAIKNIRDKKIKAHEKRLVELNHGKNLLQTESQELDRKLSEIKKIKVAGVKLNALKEQKSINNLVLVESQSKLEAARAGSTPAELAHLESEFTRLRADDAELDQSIKKLENYLEDTRDMLHEAAQDIWDRQLQIKDELNKIEKEIQEAVTEPEKSKARFARKIEDKEARLSQLIAGQGEIDEQITAVTQEMDAEQQRIEIKEAQEAETLEKIRAHERNLGIGEEQLTSDAHIQARALKNQETELSLSLSKAEKEQAILAAQIKKKVEKLTKNKIELSALIADGVPEERYESLEIEIGTITADLETSNIDLLAATQTVEEKKRELEQIRRGNSSAITPDNNPLGQRLAVIRSALTPPMSPSPNQPRNPTTILPHSAVNPPPPPAYTLAPVNELPAESPPAYESRRDRP